MILPLILALALSDAEQAKHDDMERSISARLAAQENAIWEIWRPSPKVLSDYRVARHCYIQFHLYKVDGCEKEIGQVADDLRLTSRDNR
jgi:hypothetical protein